MNVKRKRFGRIYKAGRGVTGEQKVEPTTVGKIIESWYTIAAVLLIVVFFAVQRPQVRSFFAQLFQ